MIATAGKDKGQLFSTRTFPEIVDHRAKTPLLFYVCFASGKSKRLAINKCTSHLS